MLKAKVVKKEFLTEKIILLSLEVPKFLLESFKPGQFLKIKVFSHSYDPLCPRPFTVHFIEEKALQILFQIVGKGTYALSNVKEGDELEILGPLGKPFPEEMEFPLALCAGGLGIAGFGFFLEKLPISLRKVTFLYYGVKSQGEFVRLELFKSLVSELKLATEDGSIGFKGFVTDLLEKDLQEGKIKTILGCGPIGMLRQLKNLEKKFKIKTFLSLETFLACGTGFCLGCVIPKREGGYFHLCLDGPTLPADEVII